MLEVYARHLNRLNYEQSARVQRVRDELADLWSRLMPNVHDDAVKSLINEKERTLASMEDQDASIDYMERACVFLNRHAHAEANRDAGRRAATTADERARVDAEFQALDRAITHDFLEALHPDLLRQQPSGAGTAARDADVCVDCGARRFRIDTQQGTRNCVSCGLATPWTTNPAAEPQQAWVCKYQRINHLREVLRQKMATQMRPPPAEVEMLVRVELYKRRSSIAITAVTPNVVTMILRDNRQSRYFKYATAIAVRINPTYQPKTIAPADYERIVYMFVCAEGPFEQIKRRISQQRKNFMSYEYVCYQICVLCGFTQYLSMFGLLKSVALQQQSDMFWLEVCKQLHWPFNPTVGNACSARDFRVLQLPDTETESVTAAAAAAEEAAAAAAAEGHPVPLFVPEEDHAAAQDQDWGQHPSPPASP